MFGHFRKEIGVLFILNFVLVKYTIIYIQLLLYLLYFEGFLNITRIYNSTETQKYLILWTFTAIPKYQTH